MSINKNSRTVINSTPPDSWMSSHKKIDFHSPAHIQFMLGLGIICVEMSVVFAVHPSGVLGFLYFLLLTLFFYKLLLHRNILEPLLLYGLYTFLAISLYALQYWSVPEYIGFSGPRGIGTDDGFFFSQIATSIPYETYVANITPFSKLLHFVSLYPVTHPFDILFFTVMMTVFIPVFTREVALIITNQKKVAKLAFILVGICPFTLSNALILVRDGATVALFMGSLYFFLKRQYLTMGILASLLFYVRIASGLQLVFALAFFVLLRLIQFRRTSSKIFYLLVIFLAGSIVISLFYPTIYTYLEGKHIIVNSSFIREGYVERMAQGTATSDSIFFSIYQKGLLIRVPFGFLYFLFTPFFVPRYIIKNGIFIPRVLLENIAAVLFWFYFKWFVQGIFKIWKGNNLSLKFTVLTYLALILMLSQLSIQFRHKVMILPLFYIIVAYGYYNREKVGIFFGGLGSISLAATQILRALIRVF